MQAGNCVKPITRVWDDDENDDDDDDDGGDDDDDDNNNNNNKERGKFVPLHAIRSYRKFKL